MALTVELATLSEELLEDAARERLPPGWYLEITQNETTDMWRVRVLDDNRAEQWKVVDITPKQVLLHAVGWLEIRDSQAHVNPQWARRTGEITTQRLHEAAFRQTAPEKDPADLDPEEVVAVYGSRPRHGG
jgi:hypothetical protein